MRVNETSIHATKVLSEVILTLFLLRITVPSSTNWVCVNFEIHV